MAPIAATRPAWASLVTRPTPDRPRAVSDRQNLNLNHQVEESHDDVIHHVPGLDHAPRRGRCRKWHQGTPSASVMDVIRLSISWKTEGEVRRDKLGRHEKASGTARPSPLSI